MHLKARSRLRGAGGRAAAGLAQRPRRHRLPQPPSAVLAPLPAAAAEQLSYVRGRTELPLLRETIGQALERAAATWTGNEAVVSVAQGIRLSYHQLLEQAQEVARGLIALGVGHGDRVAIWSPNCTEWTILSYACFQIGAVLVNINPAYREHELEHALNLCKVQTLVLASHGSKGLDYVQMVDRLVAQGRLPHLEHRVVLPHSSGSSANGSNGSSGYGSSGYNGASSSIASGSLLAWESLRGAGEAEGSSGRRLAAALSSRSAELRPEQCCNIQFTSGTTGNPKAAMLSHSNILNNGLFIGEACRYTPEDRVCVAPPLFHCFGLVIGNMACLTHGSTAVYPSASFSPEKTLQAVEAERCTSLYGVPSMFIQELEHPRFSKYRLDTLRTGVMAGSPCPVEVMKKVQREMHMTDVTICYGMTETSPVSFQSSVDDSVERRVTTVGRIHPHLEAKIIDPGTGALVPRGQFGELCVRGYSVMLGYWDDQAATAEAVDEDGFMHTGDLATLDAEGYCNVVGRRRDVVIFAGENIQPREVEEMLHSHPAIAEASCFGVPDVKRGEALAVWIKLRKGKTATTTELRSWLSEQLASFKVPRYWKFLAPGEGFPMTLSGKIQKFRMREAMVAELHLEEAAAVRTA